MHNNMPNHDLIQLHQRTIGDAQVATVSARQLHFFLEVGKDFSNWIKDRINAFGFAEGQDFVIVENEFSPNLAKTSGGRPTKEYFLAIDMAKELSMVERNDKGKQARRYFIECEKRLVAAPPATPVTREQRLAEAFLISQEIVGEQKLVIERLEATKADLTAANAGLQADKAVLDRIANADGAVNLTTAAKLIGQPPQKTIAAAHAHRLIYRRAGQRNWTAHQPAIAQGLLTHKVYVEVNGDGTEKVREQVMVTPKGLAKLARLMGTPLPPDAAPGPLL